MTSQLTFAQFLILCGYAAGMAIGQILFKLAAPTVTGDRPLAARAVALAQDPYFLAAMAVYLGLSLLWVWILSFTPLSRAYPFIALAIVITPLLAAALFSEPLSFRLIVGLCVIVVGLLLVAG